MHPEVLKLILLGFIIAGFILLKWLRRRRN